MSTAIHTDNLFPQQCASQAQLAFSRWTNETFPKRLVAVEAWVSQLAEAETDVTLQSALVGELRLQCQHASHWFLAANRPLKGATGEDNRLTWVGRGVFAVYVAPLNTLDSASTMPSLDREEQSCAALLGQILAAILAGNSALILVPDQTQNARLTHWLTLWQQTATSHFTDQAFVDTIQVLNTPVSDTQTTHNSDNNNKMNSVWQERLSALNNLPAWAGLAMIAGKAEVIAVNRLLAMQSGAILPLIYDCDLNTLQTLHSRDYVLRFASEKTCSINITAVGGNAELLSLGQR